MTKLQKIGLIIAITSVIAWFIWLCIWLYADFDSGGWISVWVDPIITNDVRGGFDVNHVVYYALIVAFAVGIALILEECSRKSLKKSLILLFVSCLLWWLFWSLSIRYFATLCVWCTDYIAYGFWILFLIFLVLWFISLFYTVRYLINNKWWIIILLGVLGLISVLCFWTNVILCRHNVWSLNGLSLLDCLEKSSDIVFWILLIISIILCVIFWIKSYKEVKKSS